MSLEQNLAFAPAVPASLENSRVTAAGNIRDAQKANLAKQLLHSGVRMTAEKLEVPHENVYAAFHSFLSAAGTVYGEVKYKLGDLFDRAKKSTLA